ncbi:MAG: hypothetical protein VYA17_14720 [Pseudomonadota bacterium]|nr:hypothetical protein [Pseudomonadota bacterium]
MQASQTKLTIIFLAFWTAVVGLLFVHTSGIVHVPLLTFPQARGNLFFLQEYEKTNILGIGEKVIAIPHGIPFVHPKRVKKFQKENIFVGASRQEAKRMVDAGTQDLDEVLYRLNIEYKSVAFLRIGKDIYGVPAIDQESGNPFPIDGWNQYDEKLIGASVEEARRYMDERNWTSN